MTERFELMEQLGRGGMGVVWKARDGETGQIVALKVLHSLFASDPDYVARFEREVEIGRRIESPCVVKVLGFGRRDGAPYLVMEYVEGASLKEMLKERGRLPWDEARPILRQVADGLEAAHAADVIHRDVKPSNILIAPDGSAKVADFGIARAMDLTALTGSSTMPGTPHYMAPEATTTPAADWYALGCIAYEMLAGAPPFTGDTMQQVLIKHIRDEPDLSKLPPQARDVVGALLDKDPERRMRRVKGTALRAFEPPTPAPAEATAAWSPGGGGKKPVRRASPESAARMVHELERQVREDDRTYGRTQAIRRGAQPKPVAQTHNRRYLRPFRLWLVFTAPILVGMTVAYSQDYVLPEHTLLAFSLGALSTIGTYVVLIWAPPARMAVALTETVALVAACIAIGLYWRLGPLATWMVSISFWSLLIILVWIGIASLRSRGHGPNH